MLNSLSRLSQLYRVIFIYIQELGFGWENKNTIQSVDHLILLWVYGVLFNLPNTIHVELVSYSGTALAQTHE